MKKEWRQTSDPQLVESRIDCDDALAYLFICVDVSVSVDSFIFAEKMEEKNDRESWASYLMISFVFGALPICHGQIII